VGERLFALSYLTAQLAHIASGAGERPDVALKTLKAMPELAANLYVHLAALDAAIPTEMYGLQAPSVFSEEKLSDDARAAARVRLVRQAYADYRTQGGLA
jgi:hypothetical protein